MEKTTLLEFPCEFPIKVVGKKCDEFEITVLGIIHKHFPSLAEGAIQMRPSQNNNYLAITVTATATSQAQLDAMYHELSASEWVIMAL